MTIPSETDTRSGAGREDMVDDAARDREPPGDGQPLAGGTPGGDEIGPDTGAPQVAAVSTAEPDTEPLQVVGVCTAAFVGAVMVELAGGRPENLAAWALLVLGAALLALVSGGGVYLGVKRGLYRLREITRRAPKQRPARTAATATAIVLALGLALATAPPALGLLNRVVFGCPQATELTVLTSPSGLNPTIELVERYERWTAARDGGCAAVSTYVYATPDATVAAAVGRGWSVDDDGRVNPLRDVGPRPDAWFPDSDVDLLRLDEQVRARHIAADEPVALSPLVLAVPAPVRARLPVDARPWPELIGLADAAGLGVVRADPTVSVPANVATAAIYAGTSPGGEPQGLSTDPRTVERLIGRSLDRDRYPVADGPEVLCRHRQLAAPEAALIVSERDVVRYNRGSALGGTCGAPDRPRSGDQRLLAVYAPDSALPHPFVRFRWTPEGSRQAAAVAGLEEWLADEPGRRALEEVGLRPVGEPVDPASFAAAGAQQDPPLDVPEVTPETVDATTSAFTAAQRRGRVLLALDVSGSMKEVAVPPNPTTRLRAVTEGVGRAVARARDIDEIGLWLFPADRSGLGVDRAVPVGPLDAPLGSARRRDVLAQVLGGAEPAGNTPLFDAVGDGVVELAPSDDTTIAKLIVVTDGEDTTSTRRPDDLLDEVRSRDVRVFFITIGETSCSAAPLESVTASTGGACYAETPAAVGLRVADILAH